MKRFALIVGAALGLLAGSGAANASWASLKYSGYQPWYNIFAKRNKCLTPEEERLQKFWHDYYNALRNYYGALDNIDWVAYYKNHGYQINCSGGPYGSGRINYAPVFVSPSLQWAVPSASLSGPPSGPSGGYGDPSYAAAQYGAPYGGGAPYANYMPPMGMGGMYGRGQ